MLKSLVTEEFGVRYQTSRAVVMLIAMLITTPL